MISDVNSNIRKFGQFFCLIYQCNNIFVQNCFYKSLIQIIETAKYSLFRIQPLIHSYKVYLIIGIVKLEGNDLSYKLNIKKYNFVLIVIITITKKKKKLGFQGMILFSRRDPKFIYFICCLNFPRRRGRLPYIKVLKK